MEEKNKQEKKFLHEKISNFIHVTKTQNQALLKVLDYLNKDKEPPDLMDVRSNPDDKK